MSRYSRSGKSIWITRRCGCKYWKHAKRKLCRHDVIRIRSQWGFGAPGRRIAREHDIAISTVSEIVNRKRWVALVIVTLLSACVKLP